MRTYLVTSDFFRNNLNRKEWLAKGKRGEFIIQVKGVTEGEPLTKPAHCRILYVDMAQPKIYVLTNSTAKSQIKSASGRYKNVVINWTPWLRFGLGFGEIIETTLK